jgi:hypothetical protein
MVQVIWSGLRNRPFSKVRAWLFLFPWKLKMARSSPAWLRVRYRNDGVR